MWEAPSKQQHSRHVLAMVHYTLPTGYRGQPAIVFGASFVLIPSHQVRTSLSDTLEYLKHVKEDSVILVSTPAKPTFSPQPWKSQFLTLLPISGNPNIDRGPLHLFAAATLPTASREGRGGQMPMRIKLLPSFGSSKRLKTELLWEHALLRGLLWQNIHYVERNTSGNVILGQTRKPICQELTINLVALGRKMEYTPTGPGVPAPLTLAACHPSWDDYLDLGK